MRKWQRESVLDLYNLLLAAVLFASPWLFKLTNGPGNLDFFMGPGAGVGKGSLTRLEGLLPPYLLILKDRLPCFAKPPFVVGGSLFRVGDRGACLFHRSFGSIAPFSENIKQGPMDQDSVGAIHGEK